jgi:hypothetical protein
MEFASARNYVFSIMASLVTHPTNVLLQILEYIIVAASFWQQASNLRQAPFFIF